MSHNRYCIEMAITQIAENNEATRLLEPGRELTPETEDWAHEWLDNGTAQCMCDHAPVRPKR